MLGRHWASACFRHSACVQTNHNLRTESAKAELHKAAGRVARAKRTSEASRQHGDRHVHTAFMLHATKQTQTNTWALVPTVAKQTFDHVRLWAVMTPKDTQRHAKTPNDTQRHPMTPVRPPHPAPLRHPVRRRRCIMRLHHEAASSPTQSTSVERARHRRRSSSPCHQPPTTRRSGQQRRGKRHAAVRGTLN